SKVVWEIKKTDEVIKSITGKTPLIFRPPFGVTNPNIKKALKQTGHHSIGWSKRSFDTTSLSEETIFKRVSDQFKRDDVILLHDQNRKTIVVLERLLLFLEQHQLKSVSVDQWFEIQAYA